MKKKLIKFVYLILAFLPIVAVAMAEPMFMMNPENTNQSAWFVYAPGWTVSDMEESWIPVNSLHTEEYDYLEEYSYAKIYVSTFFPEYTPVAKDGQWYLYRPESHFRGLVWKKLYRVTPWFDDK